MTQLLPLAISMGDPAGIGPEIVLRWWQDQAQAHAPVWVAGDVRALQRAAQALNQHWHWRVFVSAQEVAAHAQTHALTDQEVWVVDDGACAGQALPEWGRIDPVGGHMAVEAIRVAAWACLHHQARALVTAPINKESMHSAGYSWPGHTEMLQEWAAQHMGVPLDHVPVQMMLANAEICTVLLTTHCSLRQAIEHVTQQNVFDAITRIYRSWPDRAQASGLRVAVAGLNPHAGEGGQFGDEEILHILPAIQQAQALGLPVSGPWPPDTVFMQARQGQFDVVLAMTHDHGLIPVKYMGIDAGVNVTFGIPFVRTSPDHGTAFAIAGRAQANHASFATAVQWAERLAQTHP